MSHSCRSSRRTVSPAAALEQRIALAQDIAVVPELLDERGRIRVNWTTRNRHDARRSTPGLGSRFSGLPPRIPRPRRPKPECLDNRPDFVPRVRAKPGDAGSLLEDVTQVLVDRSLAICLKLHLIADRPITGSKVTQPPVPAPRLYRGHPAAERVKDHENQDPYRVDARQ